MKRTFPYYPVYLWAATLLSACMAFAQPDFASKRVIDRVVTYQDQQTKTLFYYAPYGIQLIKDRSGKPDFKFTQMRYTGTQLTGDQGSARFKSLLRFKVANQAPSRTKIDSLKQTLKKQGLVVTTLKPLPIHNLRAIVLYAAVNETTKEFTEGFFEGADAPANAYWTERDFTLRLGNEDAQLFWDGFQKGQPTLSITYTFATKGVNSTGQELEVSGSEEFVNRMKEQFAPQKDSLATTLQERVVLAGSLSLYIDTQKWPDLVKQVDINERIPPEYPALDVYCFDFNNDIRKDLYAKRIEIKAEGVGGGDVLFKNTFKASDPDSYAKTIKFTYAVKLNKPYSYRTTEIFPDGSMKRSDWKTQENWHQILDITSQVTPQPANSDEPD
jgi:hypothetical protein